jgi:two-component system NarL family response regulator
MESCAAALAGNLRAATIRRTMAAPLRILVVDDHFVVRSGLVASLGMEEDLEVIGEGSNAAEALEQYRKHAPDLVLMDLRLQGGTGIEATAQLRQAFPEARVLIFTTFEGDEDIFRALQAGAGGYLLKSSPRDELLHAVRTVASGERYLPARVAARLAERISGDEPSARELEVLRLIGQGKSNKEIGVVLSIAEDTVKRHVSSLLLKLRVHDRAQATAEGIRRGFIHLEG